MTEADRAPALGRPSFRCPHCDAFTSQKWYGTIWTEASKKDSLPSLPGADAFEDPEIFRKLEPKNAKAQQSMMIEWRDKMRSGERSLKGYRVPSTPMDLNTTCSSASATSAAGCLCGLGRSWFSRRSSAAYRLTPTCRATLSLTSRRLDRSLTSRHVPRRQMSEILRLL